ncbi:MAG: rhodanese-like domain-containing protein, partial [Rhodospirillaceae bacterium]
ARIPTEAIHLPLSRFDPDQVPKDGAKKLVFVCAQGVRSYQAGQYLLSQGLISEAYNMDGGIAAWHYAGLPLDRD